MLIKHFNGSLSNQTTGLYPEHKNIAINIVFLFLSQLGSPNTLTPITIYYTLVTGLKIGRASCRERVFRAV